MFDFIFWKIPEKGLLIKCLQCTCTWGLTGYEQFINLSEEEDRFVTECPICGEKITASTIKACVPEEYHV